MKCYKVIDAVYQLPEILRKGVTKIFKRILSLMLCFLFTFSLIASADLDIQINDAMQKTNAREIYSPKKGNEWILNQAQIERLINEAQNMPREDESIYDMAKKSVIIKLSENVSYVNGYAAYIDPKNKEAVPVCENGITYLPLGYFNTNLDMNLTFDERTSVASVSKKEVVSLTAGSGKVTSDNEVFTYTVSYIKRGDTTYLPLRTLCEAIEKNILYNNGAIIITDNDGKELIKEDHWQKITAPGFELKRDKVLHPQPQEILRWLMSSGDRSALNYSDEQMFEVMQPFLDMTYYELAQYVEKHTMFKDDGTKRHIGDRIADIERAALFMSVMYNRSPNEDYAMRIIIMSYYTAICFDELETYYRDSFYSYAYVTPVRFIFAYDRIYHSPMWDVFENAYGFDAKDVLSLWWKNIFNYMLGSCYRDDGTASPVGNYPIKLGHMVGTGFVLDEPDMIRKMVPVLNSAISPESFFADGMWYEGSFDYGKQMVGNSDAAAILMANYTDPLDYEDKEFGISFNGSFNRRVWSDWFGFVSNLSNYAYFPDGSRAAVNDTHWTQVAKNMADNTIKEQYLENFEYNHFGFYGMKYGDTEEAQQINIVVTPASNVSHEHSSNLGISYYTAGIEVLPDQGYITPTTLHRYSKTPSFGHNTSYIYPDKEAPKSGSFFIRPNVYAYDDGEHNGKQIQLIEAGNLMAEYHGVDINRRTLLMIATDKNHSYAVDIHRLKGNEPSECYLMQTEDEDVEFETNLKLEPKFEGPLYDWLPTKNAYGGYINSYTQYSKVYKNPEGTVTDDSFWFTWKGKTSGTTLKTFVKGDDDAIIAFCEHPTIRRTEKDATKKNDFPGYYLYRRNNENIGDITTYAAVYEGYKDGETGKVLNVTWTNPKDNDKMTTMLKVELEDYVDYIYVSNDNKLREFDELNIQGSYVVVRTDKTTGEVVYSYLYGDGKITKDSYAVEGRDDLSYRVLMARGSRPTDNDVPNEIKIEGVAPEDISGYWANITFGDGSGNAFYVTGVNQSHISLHNDPGFFVTKDGATFTAYPLYSDNETGHIAKFASPYNYGMPQRQTKGDITFNIKIPIFDIRR